MYLISLLYPTSYITRTNVSPTMKHLWILSGKNERSGKDTDTSRELHLFRTTKSILSFIHYALEVLFWFWSMD